MNCHRLKRPGPLLVAGKGEKKEKKIQKSKRAFPMTDLRPIPLLFIESFVVGLNYQSKPGLTLAESRG